MNAASVYDEFFVPALFAEWAPRLVEVAGVRAHQQVLDVACGTGVLTRALAEGAGPAGVTGLDCNDAMLAVAEARAPHLRWQRGRAEALPVDDCSVDVVTCQFGLMFFEDRGRALSEMWRVLRPGGTLAVAVWGELEATPGYAAMAGLLRRLFGDDIAAELRAPFCLGARESFEALLDEAGIAQPCVDTIVGRAHFPSLEAWIHTDIRGWTLADRLDESQFEALLATARSDLARFETASGSIEFESPAHVAWAKKRGNPSG